MNIPTLGDLRNGIKATFDVAIPELTGYDTVPDTVNLPCYIVMPVTADFPFVMATPDDEWAFDLYVLVSRGDTGVGQDQLDEFISSAGPKSLREAIGRFPNLGIEDGNVRARITGMSNYGGQLEAAGVDHIGATLRLVVTIRGPR